MEKMASCLNATHNANSKLIHLVNWSSNAKRVTLLRCDPFDPTLNGWGTFSCELAKLVAQIRHHDTSRFHYYTWIWCRTSCDSFLLWFLVRMLFMGTFCSHKLRSFDFGSREETTENGTRFNVKCSKMTPTLCSTEGIQKFAIVLVCGILRAKRVQCAPTLTKCIMKLVRLQGFMLCMQIILSPFAFSFFLSLYPRLELFVRNPSLFGTFKSIFIENVHFSLNEIAHTWSTFSIYLYYIERESFVLDECYNDMETAATASQICWIDYYY